MKTPKSILITRLLPVFLLLVAIQLFPAKTLAQYTFSYEFNDSQVIEANHIQHWGEDYLIEWEEYRTSPPRLYDEVGLLTGNGQILWIAPYHLAGESTWLNSEQLPLNDSLAVAYTYELLSQSNITNWLTVIDKTGGEVMTISASLPYNYGKMVAMPESSFSLLRNNLREGLRVIEVIQYSSSLDTLRQFTVMQEDASLIMRVAHTDDAGNYYLVYSTNGSSEFRYELAVIDSEGNPVRRFGLPDPSTPYEGYIDVQEFADGRVAVLEGAYREFGLGCIVELCPQSGDVIGKLRIYDEAGQENEKYLFRFTPYGMTKTIADKLIVYGDNGPNEEAVRRGVLFTPEGWPNDSLILLVQPPAIGFSGEPIASPVYEVYEDASGDLVGVGQLYYPRTDDLLDVNQWFFSINVEDCLTDDCEALTTTKEQLVPVSNALVASMKIYPNPVAEELNVENYIPALGNATIWSVTGKQIRTVSAADLPNGVSVADLKAGIYVITFDGAARIRPVRFVKY